MVTRLINPPASEPVTLAEAKLQLRVDGTDDDTLISSLISAARERCEQIIGRSIMPQTWEYVRDCFPICDISLMWPTLISVTSIKYIDAENNEITLPVEQYLVDKDNEPGRVMIAPGFTWPSTASIPNAVRVRYQAGYADAGSVPAGIKSWIKLAVQAMYDGCGADNLDASMKQFDALLDRVRIWRL